MTRGSLAASLRRPVRRWATAGVLLILLTVGSLIPATVTTAASNWQARLQQGSSALEKGDFSRSETIAKELLSERPRAIDPMNLLGLSYLRQGRMQLAFAVFQTVRALAPERPVTWFRLAHIYRESHMASQERASLETAVRLNPYDRLAHRYLARILMDEKVFYAALAEYTWLVRDQLQRGLTVDPDDLKILQQTAAQLDIRPDEHPWLAALLTPVTRPTNGPVSGTPGSLIQQPPEASRPVNDTAGAP